MTQTNRFNEPIGPRIATQTRIGLEVEKLRLDAASRLSPKAFPRHLSAPVRAYVEREYFEAQIEFALPPQADPEANVAFADAVIAAVANQLAPAERLWPYSCPPPLSVPPSDALISRQPAATYPYRQALSQRYDLRSLMNTGVHVNLSFAPALAQLLVAAGDYADTDALYLQVAQQFMVHQWLLTALFGATPQSFAGYRQSPALAHPVRSIRSSSLGFPTSIHGDYRSVAHYVQRIEAALAQGELVRASQYYESVRLKSSAGKAPRHLLTAGVSHIELRAFDLNPLTTSGVTPAQLRLIQLLAAYFATQPALSPAAFDAQMAETRQLNETVALEDVRAPSVSQARGLALLAQVAAFAEAQQVPTVMRQSVHQAQRALQASTASLAYQVWTQQRKLPLPF
ncbi:hypothetical protein [Lacticaseibacillus daqingensis]|uniref:hypothetical protein n=1 Tax=Lacticaseibacillus daqingensis TaxID=2486014 RepID=UPI0013DD910E|nr:hypothetical protein [Lacticaseibacillus daqingensis]